MNNGDLMRMVKAANTIEDFLSIRNWEIPFREGEISSENEVIINKKARELFGPEGLKKVYAHYDDCK